MISHLYAINCKNCLIQISPSGYYGFQRNCAFPLCSKCYDLLKHKINRASKLTQILYFSLKEKKISAELEESDGYKTIDILVENAKLHIEVDGDQHNLNSKQALTDLKRTYYSIKKGFYTLRIPNSLVRDNLPEASVFVMKIIEYRLAKAI